ncbi:MAG: hypothetical protein M0Z27_09915 [Thermaerobacter sp.]|nr:hypothetical protein [Thermaerobacter sp.]
MPEKLQVAYLSTYVPQECGIATFTEDLLRGVGADRSQLPGWVLAMNDGTVEGGYPPEVVQVVREDHPEDYLRVADWVNDGPVNLVSVQHEFGIYGGEDGSYLLEFLRRLKSPRWPRYIPSCPARRPGSIGCCARWPQAARWSW